MLKIIQINIKNMVSIKKKLVKRSNGYIFPIKKALIDEGLLKEGREYILTIEEIRDKSLI